MVMFNEHFVLIISILLCADKIKFNNAGEVLSAGDETSDQYALKLKRQISEETGCFLPEHPRNGEYKVLGESGPYLPNSFVEENVIIDLSCRKGYITQTGGVVRAICFRSEWTPPLEKTGRCVQTCPPVKPQPQTLAIKCSHNNEVVSCDKAVEGTRLEVKCKPSFEVPYEEPITCRDGSWDYPIPTCQRECGRKPVYTEEEGSAHLPIFPWVAIVYKDKEFFTGGSVISRYHVLTDAHPFTDSKGQLRDIAPYIVAAGKSYRDYDDQRDAHKQTSKISRISIPELYRDTQENYALDFAVLTLEIPFDFDDYIQPVCIDWDNRYEKTDFVGNSKGLIASWISVYDKDALKNLTVTFKSVQSCHQNQIEIKKFTDKYYKQDKFCGVVDNWAKVCSGEPGNGLVFQHASNSKYYVRGILSVGYWKSCSSQHVEMYTLVSYHLEQLINVTGRIV